MGVTKYILQNTINPKALNTTSIHISIPISKNLVFLDLIERGSNFGVTLEKKEAKQNNLLILTNISSIKLPLHPIKRARDFLK